MAVGDKISFRFHRENATAGYFWYSEKRKKNCDDLALRIFYAVLNVTDHQIGASVHKGPLLLGFTSPLEG